MRVGLVVVRKNSVRAQFPRRSGPEVNWASDGVDRLADPVGLPRHEPVPFSRRRPHGRPSRR